MTHHSKPSQTKSEKDVWRHPAMVGVGYPTAVALVLGVVTLITRPFGLGVGPLSPTTRSPTPSATAMPTTEPSGDTVLAYPIGGTGRDGHYEVTLLNFQCGDGIKVLEGKKEIPPQGQYCTADIKYVNRSVTAGDVRFGAETLYVSDFRYPAETRKGPAVEDTIFPDYSATAIILFDIPEGQEPTLLEIHTASIYPETPGVWFAV